MAIGRYAGIAGIEDFINAGDSPDYYDMYLDAGKNQTELELLALAQEGKMNEAAANALSTVYQGIANSKILEKKAGTKPHPLNTALNIGATVAGAIPGGGGGGGFSLSAGEAADLAAETGAGPSTNFFLPQDWSDYNVNYITG
tara:strand:- start:423 stop:851 length:429 start_codon:yes stop_codon:yes gene_type:complete